MTAMLAFLLAMYSLESEHILPSFILDNPLTVTCMIYSFFLYEGIQKILEQRSEALQITTMSRQKWQSFYLRSLVWYLEDFPALLMAVYVFKASCVGLQYALPESRFLRLGLELGAAPYAATWSMLRANDLVTFRIATWRESLRAVEPKISEIDEPVPGLSS